jgi:hypothetical protein
MGKSKGILVLACFLLSPMIFGVVYAQQSSLTLTTDKSTYNPGETVTVTVTCGERDVASGACSNSLLIEIVPVPFPACGYSCPTASGTVDINLVFATTAPYYAVGAQGTVALKLPNNTTAGHYDVGILYCTPWVINNGQPTCVGQNTLYQGAIVGITVTGQTPVPETPSVLTLLLPAFLAVIYVLRRRKN